jgi:hypothetical protein
MREERFGVVIRCYNAEVCTDEYQRLVISKFGKLASVALRTREGTCWRRGRNGTYRLKKGEEDVVEARKRIERHLAHWFVARLGWIARLVTVWKW